MSDRSTLVERVKACGSYFFEPDTMRFFRSRLLEPVYPSEAENATYFVTSEVPYGRREYTVRKFINCTVKTVDRGYATARQARATAREEARGPRVTKPASHKAPQAEDAVLATALPANTSAIEIELAHAALAW